MPSYLCLYYLRLSSTGDKLSKNRGLEARYYRDPEACDLSELMVVANVISGYEDIVALFWENKLGIDVDVCAFI